MTVAPLMVPGGACYAVAMRHVISTTPRAEAAALITEGWMSIPMTLAERDVLRAQGIQPKDLPPDQRRDALWVIGETAGGLEDTRAWIIEPPDRPGGLRRFVPHTMIETGKVMTRFRPMFPRPGQDRGVGYIHGTRGGG